MQKFVTSNVANFKMRSANPELYKGMEIHEIHPVKFGGSPTDISNKMVLPKGFHRGTVSPWWKKLQNIIEKI